MTEHQVQQRSEDWFAARRGIPTASRFKSILTPVEGKPSRAQDSLIDELIAESILPPEQGVIRPVTADMEYGIRLEGEARSFFDLNHAKAPVREVGFLLHESGLFGCSPDALVGDDSGLELKCPNGVTHVGYVRAGVLPPEYKCQVHGSMAVSGRRSWHFMSYARHFDELHLLVEWDDFTDKLAAELMKFCVRYNAERAKFGLPPIGRPAA